MALLVCVSDQVKYSVGARCCPECGCTDSVEDGSPEYEELMAKLTRHGDRTVASIYDPTTGSTDPAAAGPDETAPVDKHLVNESPADLVTVPADEPTAAAGEHQVDTDGTPREGGELPADGSEHVLVDNTPPAGEPLPPAPDDGYDAMTIKQLQAELAARELDTTGTPKSVLVERLRADDAANARPADAQGVDGTERS